MGKRRLPVVRTIITAYRDLGRLLTAMPALMASAFVILLAVAGGAELVPQRLWDRQPTGEVLGLVQNVVEALLLTPVFMAIHRFVILDKVTRTYTLPIGETAFGVFFGWLLALKVLIGLPFDLLGLVETLTGSLQAILFVFAVALIAAVTVALRLIILFPALAVGASGATASRALADSKGQALRLLAVLCLSLLPWVAASYGGAVLLGRGAMITGSPLGMLFLLMSGVLQTIMLALTAVIASYAFMVLAEQVKRRAR